VKENQPQLYKAIQALFAPEYPKPGFGKIQTDFLSAQARRWFAAHLSDAFALLTTPFSR
jgi:hypothetical protein